MVDEPCAVMAPFDEERVEAEASFEAFFRQHHVRLFGTLCLVSGDRGEAEELMQEAFLRIWERWQRVSAHPDPVGYLYRTAFNLERDRGRRLRRAAGRMTGASSSTDAFDRVDERTDVLDALRKLSPRQRAAVVLTDLLGLDSSEAGRMLGVRAVTVRSLASQARSALRPAL